MGIRRSGRTFAALRAAVAATENGTREVNFVVWQSPMIDMIHTMLYQELYVSSHIMAKLRVVSYKTHLAMEKRGRYHGRSNPSITVVDHFVLEELEYQRTGKRSPDTIKVVLECNDWEREEVISLAAWDRGHYRMAMCEPLNTMAYASETFAGDASATVKVVEFHRTNRVNRDGLLVFSHKV